MALTKDREQRFASCREMAKALAHELERTLERRAATESTRTGVGSASTQAPEASYRLRITHGDGEERVFPLEKENLTIGRDEDNDIVLEHDRIARTHARILRRNSGWILVDLGGLSGTWLDDRRLVRGKPVTMGPGSSCRIGPYLLKLEWVDSLGSGKRDDDATQETPTSPAELVPFQLFAARKNIALVPGEKTELWVEVVNQSSVTHGMGLRVRGVPREWYDLPVASVQVGPGQSAKLPIRWQPPRKKGMPVGRQLFRIELVVQNIPEVSVAASGTLDIRPFEVLSVRMKPRKLALPGTTRLQIENLGNATAEVAVIGRDNGDEIQFRGESGHRLASALPTNFRRS